MSQSSIPNSWLSIPIKESFISVSVTNKKLKQKEYKISGSIPVVDQGKDLIGGFTDDNNLKIKIEQPMIIFGDHTKILKFVSFDFAVGADGVKVLKPKKYFLPKLYYYFLHCVKFQDKGYARHFQYLQKEAINLPPYEEQIRIVEKIEELFTKLDTSVTELKNVKKQLKRYRQSVLKSAFEGKLTEEWRRKNNEPIWREYLLKNLGVIKRGKSKHRPRNAPKLYGGNYPFIQTGDIRNANGKVINKYSQTYSDEGLKQSKLWPKGTLCITIAANIGDTAILGFDSCFPDSVVGFTPFEELTFSEFINYYIIYLKQDIENLAPATAQKNINVAILEKIEINTPTLDEQQKIVEEIETRFSGADKIEEEIDKNLKQTEQLRQSILKKAFEGKLVPQDPKDEPAEKLLERIKKEKERLKLL